MPFLQKKNGDEILFLTTFLAPGLFQDGPNKSLIKAFYDLS